MLNNKKLIVEKAPPLYLRIYQILKEAIVNGDFSPGEQLKETRLAEQLEVSRTPIRDALRQLENDGLIVIPDSGIATVFTPTVFDAAEIYIVRASLEAQAASMIASSQDDLVVEELRKILSKTVKAYEAKDVRQIVDYNTEFHRTIIQSSLNNRLIQTIESMHLQIMQIRTKSLSNLSHRSTSLEEHHEIVDRLEKDDPLSVGNYVSAHILKAGYRVVDYLGIPDNPSPAIQYLLKYNE